MSGIVEDTQYRQPQHLSEGGIRGQGDSLSLTVISPVVVSQDLLSWHMLPTLLSPTQRLWGHLWQPGLLNMLLPWFRTGLSHRGEPALSSGIETEGKSVGHRPSIRRAAEHSVVLLGEGKEPHTQEEKKTDTHSKRQRPDEEKLCSIQVPRSSLFLSSAAVWQCNSSRMWFPPLLLFVLDNLHIFLLLGTQRIPTNHHGLAISILAVLGNSSSGTGMMISDSQGLRLHLSVSEGAQRLIYSLLSTKYCLPLRDHEIKERRPEFYWEEEYIFRILLLDLNIF